MLSKTMYGKEECEVNDNNNIQVTVENLLKNNKFKHLRASFRQHLSAINVIIIWSCVLFMLSMHFNKAQCNKVYSVAKNRATKWYQTL